MMRSSAPSTPEVLRYLGGGGMADVYLARLPDGELAALKRLRPQLAAEPDLVQQLEREARIGQLLVHENIVGFKGFAVDASGPYLILEYIEGLSASAFLSAWVTRNRTHLPINAALSILADLADGLGYAHAIRAGGVEGVIHRDISPDNVLVALNGCAKLSDFGIAKILGTTKNTRTGTVRGKFGYLAPELFEHSDASAQSDVFSLGATAFRLLCGVSAFQGESEAQLVRAVLHGQPAKVLTLRSDVPAAVAEWVDQSLSKNPTERPPLSDLSKLLRGIRETGRPLISSAVRELYEPAAEILATQAPKRSTVAVSTRRSRFPMWVVPSVAVAFGAMVALWVSWPTRATPPPVVVDPPPHRPAVVTPEPAVAPKIEVPIQPAQSEPPRPKKEISTRVIPTPPSPSRATKKPRAPPRVASSAEKPPPPVSVKTTGTLRVKVRPWGEVFVDGTLRGVAPPLAPLELSAGKHSVIVVNKDAKQKRTYQVDVIAGKETELKAILDETKSP